MSRFAAKIGFRLEEGRMKNGETCAGTYIGTYIDTYIGTYIGTYIAKEKAEKFKVYID